MLMLNFPFIYNFLEVELRGCDHDLRTMIEHFPLTARYFIYSIPKAKCRPGHLNVNSLNIAIGHSLHLQSLHHNPHYHQHQHQGDLTLGWSLNFFCDVNRDLLRSFNVNTERVQIPLPLLRHVQHKADTTVETRDFLALTKVTAAKRSLLTHSPVTARVRQPTNSLNRP